MVHRHLEGVAEWGTASSMVQWDGSGREAKFWGMFCRTGQPVEFYVRSPVKLKGNFKKTGSKLRKVMGFSVSLLISSLVFQLLQVSTASTYDDFFSTYDSRIYEEDWGYEDIVESQSNYAHHNGYNLWGQMASGSPAPGSTSSIVSNWSITVSDTGLGAHVQVVYIGMPVKLDAALKATLEGPGANVTASLGSAGGGGYAAYLSAGAPGEYTLSLTEGAATLGSPVTVHVASQPSPFTSVVTPCTSPLDTGTPCLITVEAKDAADVVRTTPGKLCPFKIVIWDDKNHFYRPDLIMGPIEGDGKCNITFTPLRSRVYTARVSIGGKTLTNGGLFNITAAPAASAEANFLVESPDQLADGTYAVGSALFNVRSKDPTYKAIHGFTINIVSPNLTLERECLDIRTSPDCSFVINVTRTFIFQIDVMLDNTTKLSASIAAAQFSAAFITGASSRISGNSTVALTSGEDSSSYDVSLMDDYGNLATNYSTGDYYSQLVVDLVPVKTPSCYQYYTAEIAAGADDGLYTAAFKNVTCAGNYTVRAWFGHSNNLIEGSGLELDVSAGAEAAGESILFANSSMFTAGGTIGVSAFIGDAYGNPVSDAVVSFALANTDATITSNHTAVFRGDHWVADIGEGITTAGTYDLSVVVGGTNLLTGSANCTPGALDATMSTFTFATNITAGSDNNFTLTLVDKYGNLVEIPRGPLLKTNAGAVHTNGSAAAWITVDFDENNSSSLILGMRAEKAGTYQVKIPYNKLVADSEEIVTEVTVYPGPLDAGRSSIVGPGLSGGVAGGNFTVYIIPRDNYGNLLEPNDVDKALITLAVTVTDRATPPVVTPITPVTILSDIENGRYVTEFNATVSGTCRYEITVDSSVGFAEFNIRAGPFSGAESTLSGMGLKGSIVNQPATFFINAKDGFGNAMDDLGSAPIEFTAKLCKTGAICVNGTCTDDCNSAGRIAIRDRHIYGGMYAVVWSAPTVGTYSISLTSGNENITGSPVTPLTVITLAQRGPPTATNPMICEGIVHKDWCPGYFGSTAGVKARFTVGLGDADQNFVTSSGTSFSIALTPADPTAVIEIIDTNNGYYTIVYVITKIPDPPEIDLAVSLDSATVTTAKLNMTPAWTSPEKSTIDPMFASLLTAGDTLETTITPKDAFGNKQVYGPTYPLENDMFMLVAIRETGERVFGSITWDDTNSVWNATLRLTWSGIYYVSVMLKDVALGTTGATTTITVNPAVATIENSILLQPWLPSIRSMESSYFEVPALADEFGNLIVKDVLFTANATYTSDPGAIPVIELVCSLTNTTYALATCEYSFNKSGIYNISYGAKELVAYTQIEILSGDAADISTVEGSATTNCTVGQLSVMTILCKDIQENNCSGQPATAFRAVLTPATGAAFTNGSSDAIIADIWSTPDGETFASYIVKEVGNYTLNVTLQNGVNVTGSPFMVKCDHAFSSPARSFAYVVDPPRKLDNEGEVAMVAGTVVELGVMILDANGNRQTITGDTLTVAFAPEDASLLDTGAYLSAVKNFSDATFNFKVSAFKVGTYVGNELTPIKYILNVNCTTADEPSKVDQGIGGAPFTFVVLPDVLSVASTSVTLLASNPDEKGLTSTFRIITQDAYGNIAAYNQTLNVTAIVGKWEPPVVEEGVPPGGEAAPPPPNSRRLLQTLATQVVFPQEGGGYTITPVVVNNFDGTYTFTFSVTAAGPYNISVFIDSEQIGTGPWTIEDFEVDAGSPDFARLLPVSNTLGKDAEGLLIGTPGNLTIAIADIFGNPVTVGSAPATTYSANITAAIQLRKLQVNAYKIFEDTASNVTLGAWTIDPDDGTISSTYTCTSSGIVAFYMWFGDTETDTKYLSAMTPVSGPVLAGPLDTTTLRAYGGGLVAALISPCDENGYCVTMNNTIEIEMFDANRNVLNPEDLAAECANLTTEYNATDGLMTMAREGVVSRSGKTCVVSYSVADTNLTFIKVSFNISYLEQLLTGSPWTVPLKTKTSDINIAKSFLWGDLGGVIEAGKVGIVTAQLVDKDGVWLTYSPMEGNEYVQLITYNQTEGVLSPTLSTQDNGDGTFTLTYTTTSTGTFGYQPVIGYNMRAFGPVFVIRVVASETVVATTSVSLISTNYTIYRAGFDPVLIEVQPTDLYSNLQDYYFASPDMFQAKIQRPDGTVAYKTLDRVVTKTPYGVQYHKWLLTYYPEQAPATSSTLHIFDIKWSNGTSEEMVPAAPIKIYSMPGPPAPEFIKIIGQGGSRAIVGKQAGFIVQLYDKFNNPVAKLEDVIQYNITMVLYTLADEELINQPCTPYPSPPGGLCSFTIYEPGTYNIDVWANSERLLQQSVTVNEPSIYAPNCRASGDGVGTTDNPVIAGVETQFMIEAFDLLNNSLTASSLSNVTTTFEVSGYNLVSSGVIRPAPGYPFRLPGTNRVIVKYTVSKSGRYAVNVKRAGVHISGSPYYVTVNPGEISSMSTVDEETLSNCTSGESHRVKLTARDKQGNIRTHVEDTLTIIKTVQYANESITDVMKPLGQGVYVWNFTCVTAGTPDDPFTTDVKIFSYRSQVWSGVIPVLPGVPDPKQFIVGAFDLVSVGDIGTTTVVTADSAGNLLWNGELPIDVFLMHPDANTSASGEDWYNGTYTFTWMMTKAGQYTVVAEYNSTSFFQEPIWIFPGPADAKSTSVLFDTKGQYTAGVEGTLWIQLFDAYMNNITSDDLVPTDLYFESLSSDPEARRVTFMAAELKFVGGMYTVTFIPHYAGILKMYMKINGEDVLQSGMPYSTQVVAGPPTADRLYAWGGGWTAGGVVGKDTMFFLRMRDVMDNLVETEPAAPLTVTFTPAVAPEALQTYMGQGMMMITYVPSTAAAEYVITVAYDSVPSLISGALMCNETVGNYSAARSVIMGSDGAEIDNQAVLYSIAGETVAFGIEPRDESGFTYPGPPVDMMDTVKTPVYVLRITSTPTQFLQADPITFYSSFEFSSTEAKDYTVIVQSRDGTKELKNSGFTVKFLPGPTAAPNCVVTTVQGLPFDSNKPLTAGTVLTLLVQAKDAFDNVQNYNLQNADVFVATLAGETISQGVGVPIDYKAVYSITLRVPIVAGPGTLAVSLNGIQVVSYSVLVTASALYLPGTEITPWYFDPMIAGQEAYFDIVPVDVYQNVINSMNATQQIFATLAKKIHGVEDPVTHEKSPDTYVFIEQAYLEPGNINQGLRATVMPKVVGDYSVVVASSTGRMSGDISSGVVELATVEILPGTVDITRSFATVDSAYLAGSSITFRVTGLDSYNNLVPTLPSVTSDPYYNIMVTAGVCTKEELALAENTTKPCKPRYTADVMFTPHGYGDINVTVTWDGIDILEYKTGVAARGAPTMITSQMEDTGGSILVTFVGASDAGLRSMRGMRDGPERCAMLLDNITYSKLGVGPACGFKDATTMYIQLGYNATLMPAGSPNPDNITLAPEGVFAEKETSLPVSGSVVVQPPNKHPSLVAVLTAPTIIGACDDFKLDASSSYGAEGRPLMFQYHAKGTGDLFKLATLGYILESLPNDTTTVTIPAGSLEANYEYTFTVVVTNYLGDISTASVNVLASVTPVPILHIPGSGSVQTFKRGQFVSLEADVRIPGTSVYDLEAGSCYSTKTPVNTSATQINFKWTQLSGPFANLEFLGVTGQTLNIPGNQLVPGNVYDFSVSVQMAGYPSQFSVASASVQVTSSPMVVFIKGRNRAINASQDLILEAVAYDPDDVVDEFGNSLPFNFEWACDIPITIPDSLLYIYTDHNFGSTIKIPANTLTNGTVYNYTVTVTKEGVAAPAMAHAEISPVDNTVNMLCEIQNSADLHLGVYSSSQVVIACTPGFQSYNWSMTSTGDQRLLWELDPLVVIEGSIKIPPYALLDARSYTITCEGKTNAGDLGKASVTFTTVMNPSGGTATLTRNDKKNNAGKTLYSIVAHGWMAGSAGGQLMYEFRYWYKKGKMIKENIIQPLSTSNSVSEFVLLGGQVTIDVYVVDSGTPRIHSNDAPPGAKYSLPVFKVSGKGRRSLLGMSFQDSYWEVANEGKYFNSLTAMQLLGIQHIGQGTSCVGDDRAIVSKMLDTIIRVGPTVPPASSTGGQSEGPGPAYALKTACVFSEILAKPGNANNFTQLQATLDLFLRDLRLISEFGLNVGSLKGQPYDPCFYDAGNAFMQAVKSKCYKIPEKNSPGQAMVTEKVSVIPNLIARTIVNDVGFRGPLSIKRKRFTAAAIRFPMSVDVYDGPNTALGTILNLKFDITSVKTGGVPIGVAMSCFSDSPLSGSTLGAIKVLLPFKSLVSVCDVSFTGHTDGDWGQTTIRGSWQKLGKLNKKDSYVPLVVENGVPIVGELKNVLASYDTAEFDFARALSRLVLIKVKGSNFTVNPPPTDLEPASPPPVVSNVTAYSKVHKRTEHVPAKTLKTQLPMSKSWRERHQMQSIKKQKSTDVPEESSYISRFWGRLIGRS
ncbi:hypothetical protein R1flu_016193 [Riccia fluitans]|uniref:PKD/REJ-like domain-containing protein n=1 Tax=Riccia fluitans TaxID=41844 RepID=A0ABD1YPZ8_9MARC